MPGNEVEDGIYSLYELDNSLQGQHLPQAGDGSWPVLNYNQLVGKLRQIGASQNLNLKTYSLQQSDPVREHGCETLSVPQNQNYTLLSPTPENSEIFSRNHQQNTNGFLLGCQSFGMQQSQPGFFDENKGYYQHNLISRGSFIFKSPQENESCESPTLTTNSERSEITEASTDLNFLKGQQQLVNTPQLGVQQPVPMQQSGYSDMQLLQQHLMIKQLQDLQRQQQLQQFGDVRQHNTLNQLSAIAKQSATGQFSPLINGTPIHEASQMFMNIVQRGTTPTTPGASNRVVFPQDQGQAFRSMALSSQQPDASSLYGTPVASARSNMSQYSQQGISNDAVNLLTKAGGQAQIPTMQSSGTFLRDQYAVSPDQVYMSQGALISSPGFQGNGPASVQSISSGNMSGSFQAGNAAQINASAKDFNGRQERAGWPAMQQKNAEIGPTQGLVPLDPMEEKLLYNMDDNFWDASFRRRTDLSVGSFSNALENSDFSNAFPSIQSGSWSALMQSAVAEASSTDTGLQEEWSGLTFQNTEQSTDNQLSNFVDSDKQQAGWIDSNLQSASSFSSKPMPMFNDSGVTSSFPGFQQPLTQFSTEQGENIAHDGSHGSLEKKYQKVTSEWVDCGAQQKKSFEGGQQVQSYMHLDNAWAGQMYEHSDGGAHQRRTTSHEDFGQHYTKHKGSSNDVCSLKTSTGGVEQVQFGTDNNLFHRKDSHDNQSTGRQVIDDNRSDYIRHADISATNEGESLGHKQPQIINGPHGIANSCEGEGEIYINRQKNYQRQVSNDSYNSKGLSGRDQGHSGQVKYFGDVSGGSANFNEVRSPLEEVTSRDDIKSVGHDGSKTAAKTSQNMLELLHKVNLSRESGAMAYSGSTDSNALAKVPEAEAHKSVAQLSNQSSVSPGFGLRLALPSQRLPNSNLFLNSQGSPQALSYLKPGQVNQTWAAPPHSVQSLPPANELSQRVNLDGKSSMFGQTGFASYSNMQGTAVAAFASSLPHLRNQSQMQPLPNSPVASQSLQATLSSTGRNPPFNLVTSQDTSGHNSINQFGQHFPVLEASQVSQPSNISGMSRQGEFSAMQNAWATLPTQQNLSVLEPLNIASLPLSMDPTNNSINSTKAGYGEMQAGKERSLQQMSSEKTDSSQPVSFSKTEEPSQKHRSNASTPPSSLSLSHSNQEILDGLKHDNNQGSMTSERDFAPAAPSLKPSSSLEQNYSLLHQIQAMNTGDTDPSKSTHDTQQIASVVGQQLHEHNSRLRNSMDSGSNSAAGGDNKMQSFFTGSREDPSVKALSQTALRNISSHEMVRFGQNSSHSQSTSSSYMDHGQGSMHMAPSWFKQYGAFRNGQMLSMSDARIAKTVSAQFSLLKPTQNMHIHASVGQVESVEASQAAIARPSSAAALVADEHFSAPYVLPSSINNQNILISRPKKRKAMTSELLPWCKEVSQGSQKLQNISVAEQEWAEATNRLCEKVEDEVEILEDMHPMIRSKRRLVLTTQLMQLMLLPAPASILRADATSNYDSVSYFVSRVALGDACSLCCGVKNRMQLSSDNSNMISEKLKTFEKIGDQKILQVMEDLTDRAKKLENIFQRLDKTVSVLDVRVDCQELERFSVINRFARFHIRGQGDTFASSSAIHKPVPQRYVTALPMPRNLPEGVQCFSL